jgi:uncharacterized membrane protein
MLYSPEKIRNSFAFSGTLAPWFDTTPWLLPLMSLIDAALVGIFISVGMFVGFSRGQTRMNRQARLPDEQQRKE